MFIVQILETAGWVDLLTTSNEEIAVNAYETHSTPKAVRLLNQIDVDWK